MSKEKFKIGKQNHTSQTGKHVGAGPVSARNKTQTGITLVALVITIIVMLILVGVALTIALNGGLFPQAKKATDEYGNAQNIEQIKAAYMMAKGKSEIENKTNREMFEEIKNNLTLVGATYEIASQSMTITTKEGKTYTLLADGELIEGDFAYLDIADGSIELRKNGYIQGALEINGSNHKIIGDLVEYTGEYMITGTSNENIVRIMDEGTYNITIKDLNLTGKEICAFNLNRNTISTDVFVNLYIEGNNYLYGEGSVALGFTGGTPNVNGVTNGSTLTIQGTGSLYAEGGKFCAGIGSGYTGFDAAARDANNIIINSGNITAIGGMNGCGIGGGHNKNVNNIIINGGNIEVNSQRGKGIGACNNGISNNIIINGGIIKSNTTKTAGQGIIGGAKGSGKVIVNGGTIDLVDNSNYNGIDSTVLGSGSNEIEINGGTINLYCKAGTGIGNNMPCKVEINGGKLNIEDRICSIPVNLSNGNYYLTKLKIGDLAKETQIIKVETNNNIEYEVNNLYTNREGYMFMLLPEGEVTVSVEAGGKTYTGMVIVTPQNTEVFVLN